MLTSLWPQAEGQNWLLGKRSGGSPGTQESSCCRNPASWCRCALPTHRHPLFMKEHLCNANDVCGGYQMGSDMGRELSGRQGGMESGRDAGAKVA